MKLLHKITTLMLLCSAACASAQLPESTTIYEGVGIGDFLTLGDTRSEVIAKIGVPDSCGNINFAYQCRYPIPGGGSLSIDYRKPDLTRPDNMSSDIAISFVISNAPGWVTTTGINSEVVADNQSLAIATYPDGEILRSAFTQGDDQFSILTDEQEGIELRRIMSIYGRFQPFGRIKIFPKGSPSSIPLIVSNPIPEPESSPESPSEISPEPGPTLADNIESDPDINQMIEDSPADVVADNATPQITCEHSIQNSWSGGFQGEITITNTGNSPIEGWQATWAYSNAVVSSSWNVSLNQSTVTTGENLSWNGRIQPGSTQSFGFVATGILEDVVVSCTEI